MPEKGGKKWWVLGCLGVIGAALLVVVSVVAFAFVSARNVQTETDVRTHAAIGPNDDAFPSILEVDQRSAGATGTAGSPRRGTVVLKMLGGEAFVEPAAPGEPLSIEARYDKRDYELTERFEDGEPWTYEANFRLTGSALLTGLKEAIGGTQPRIRLRIPVGVRIDLTVLQRQGGAVVDVGGLDLRVIEFDIENAFLVVSATQLLSSPVERFTLLGSKGAVFLHNMDRVSPAQLDIDFRMGEAQLDLRGRWLQDTEIKLTTGLSDVILRLPQDAIIEGLDTTGHVISPNVEIALPTLRFEVSQGRRGKIEIFE